MMQRFLRLALAVSGAMAMCAVVPSVGRAQGVTTGGIGGLVTDVAGNAPIEGVTITITSPSTGAVRRIQTRANGRYTLTGLETGVYRVAATMIGFGPKAIAEVRVQLSQVARADFALERQAVTLAEIVTTAPSTAADFAPTRTGAQTYVSDSAVSKLPTLNRQLQDFVKLTPQVTVNPGARGELSAAGQNNRFNAIQVDGSTQNDRFGLGDTGELGGQAGGRGISLEAVKEYQVVLSPYNVTQGGFTGALVNAVTKNGTNDFAVSGFYTLRNQTLGSNAPFIASTIFNVKQYGGSIGGPIIKDKLHFFVAGELNQSLRPANGPFVGQTGVTGANTVRVDQALVNRVNAALATYGIDGGSGDRVDNENPIGNLVARLDYTISPSSRLVVRNIYNDQKADDFFRSAATFALTSNRFKRSEQVNSLTAQLFKTFGNGTTNEFQVGYIRQRFARSFDALGPQINIQNIPSPTVPGQTVNILAGPDSNSHINQLDQDFIELRNDLTFALGRSSNHLITIGTRSDWYKVRNAFIQNAFGSWGFNSLEDLEAGNAFRYGIGVQRGDPVARFKSANVAFYAQDQWSIRPNLTLTLGIRAEAPIFLDQPGYQPAVETAFGIRTDEIPSNFTFNPRVGFNWDVDGRGETQIRGGVGLFAGIPPYVWLSNLYTNNGLSGVSQFSCGANTGRPVPAFTSENIQNAPTTCGGVGPGTGTNVGVVNMISPDYKQAQVLRATFGVDRRLPGNLVGTIDALYTRSYNSPFMINRAIAPTGVTDPYGRVMYGTLAASGAPTTNRVPAGDPFSGGAYELRNSSGDYAYSVTGGISKRFDGAWEAAAFYTYGRSYSVQDFVSSVAASNFQRARDYAGNHEETGTGISDYDRPHKVNASMTWSAPWKSYPTDISFIYTGQSGTPFTYTYSSANGGFGDLNADGVNSNDPIYIPRNASTEVTFQQYTGTVNGSASRTITTAEQAEAFDKFIDALPCLAKQRGSLMAQNSCRNPWFNSLDLSIRQGLPAIGGNKLSMQVDIYNFLNFMNGEWGQYRQNSSTGRPVTLLPHRGQTVDGKPIIRFDPSNLVEDFRFAPVQNSFNYWQAQVTFRYAY
jgi:outer membrane receptor for ferrienterochelin and colicin